MLLLPSPWFVASRTNDASPFSLASCKQSYCCCSLVLHFSQAGLILCLLLLIVCLLLLIVCLLLLILPKASSFFAT
jgi:hypothetical protein